ncbi:hypothetical protein [Autumnicola musiva]|uniref:Uncharacterized protein n=1 Tax=Autumnicola musiva TaxID=3075589 RepID=A0ABU3DAD9_9FLAO|nr:hypothetical protein [Zunongwangia sp. F117]MDT0678474.1 hypothetical protein [Zunongwangia sp. F117]
MRIFWKTLRSLQPDFIGEGVLLNFLLIIKIERVAFLVYGVGSIAVVITIYLWIKVIRQNNLYKEEISQELEELWYLKKKNKDQQRGGKPKKYQEEQSHNNT